VKRYAQDVSDRLAFEQYRPYIIMMNARSRAHLHLDRRLLAKALEEVRDGIARIESFLKEIGREELLGRSPELEVLRQLEGEIKERVPAAKIEDLRAEMENAVGAEDYERAAQLRDEIRRMEEIG
jgi:excinuclease UvrABC helicase subunit UvrB